MNIYIKGLITASVITGIITALAPESKDGGLKKYIKYITSLLLLIALISPVVPILTDIDSFSEKIMEQAKSLTEPDESGDTDEISRSNDLILKQSIENIQNGICGVIEQKFKVAKENINAEIQCETSDITNIIINKIKITITGESSSDIKAFLIEEYIREYFSCECDVIFSTG